MNRRSENPYEAFKQKNTGKLRVSRPADLFTRKRRRFPVVRVLVLTLLVLIAAGGIYNALDNRRVHVDTVTVSIPRLPDVFEGYTILHLSDLYGAQLDANQARLARALSGRSFNAVCITGDMTAPTGDTQAFFSLIDALHTTRPIFFIAGEQDPPILADDASQGNSVLSDYITGAQQHGATYLDAPVPVESGGQRIWFTSESALTLDAQAAISTLTAQLEQERTDASADTDARLRRQALEYQLDRAQRIRDAHAQMLDDDLCIVLTHAPLTGALVADLSQHNIVNPLTSRMDLVLAGHYNGGQICLPLIGPVYVPNLGFFPGAQQVRGLMRVGEVLQHVSPGLGVNPSQLLPLRLFNPPTVTLIKLTAQIE